MLASDGVWEFISSQEAIDIVHTSLEEGTMKVKSLEISVSIVYRGGDHEEGAYHRNEVTFSQKMFPAFRTVANVVVSRPTQFFATPAGGSS